MPQFEWAGSLLTSLHAALATLSSACLAMWSQIQAWSDRIDWYGLKPWIHAGIVAWCLCVLALYLLLVVDDRNAEVWTTLSLSGRWIVCLTLVVTGVLCTSANSIGVI